MHAFLFFWVIFFSAFFFFFPLLSKAAPRLCVSKRGPCIQALASIEKEECYFNITFSARKPLNLPAFGFGKGMSNATVFTVKMVNESYWSVESRKSSGYNLPSLIKPSSITMLESNVNPSWIYVLFKRPLVVEGQHRILNMDQDMVYAIFKDTYTSGHGSSVGKFQYNAFNSSKGTFYLSDTQNLSSSSSSSSSLPLLVMLHAICMATAWSLCSFAGIFIARYLKQSLGSSWFKLHISFFVLVVLFSAGGFAAIFIHKNKNQFDHFQSPHGKFGLSILSTMLVQVILGIVIDRCFNPSRTKIPLKDKLHWGLGHVLMLAGAACVIYGHTLLGQDNLLYLIINSVIIVIALFAFVFGEYHFGQTHDHYPTNNPMSSGPSSTTSKSHIKGKHQASPPHPTMTMYSKYAGDPRNSF